MIANERLTFLFQRYVTGTCTESERREFMEYVSDNSRGIEFQVLMNELWHNLPEDKKLSGQQAQRILNTILDTSATVRRPVQTPVTPLYKRTWLRVAASLLLMAACAGSIQMIWKSESTMPPSVAVALSYRTITLPDGSKVTLNYSSDLKFPETFDGKTTREVYLNGEAYFDIAHDSSKPFIVHTGSLKTVVLGTAFNIKAYDGEKNIRVTVTRGKVRVLDGATPLDTITPNQQLTYHKTSNAAESRIVDAQNITDWQEGYIHFEDITMEGAVKQLEERFHVKIRHADLLKDCRFTASFSTKESLEEILEVISEFNQLSYTKETNGDFTIAGKGC